MLAYAQERNEALAQIGINKRSWIGPALLVIVAATGWYGDLVARPTSFPSPCDVAVIAAKPHLDDAFRADRVRFHVRRLKGIAHLVERQQVVGLPNVFRNAEIPEEIELLKVDAGDGLAIPKEPTVSQ